MFSRVRQPVIAAIAVTSLCAFGAYAAAADGPGASSVADPAAPPASAVVSPSAQVPAPASPSSSGSAQAPGSASPSPSAPSAPVTAAESPYPNSAAILAKDGIKLVRGDGGITLAECGISASQIRVYTFEDPAVKRKPLYCFSAHSQTGRLTLELDRVFALDTGEHPVTAKVTSGGATTTVELGRNSYASVAEKPLGSTGRAVVELRVTG